MIEIILKFIKPPCEIKNFCKFSELEIILSIPHFIEELKKKMGLLF